MFVSLAMLLEEQAAREGLPYHTLAQEDGRGIDGIEALAGCDECDGHTLYVASAQDLQEMLPAGVAHLVAAAGLDEVPEGRHLASLAMVPDVDARELLVVLMRAMARLAAWDARLLEAIVSRQEIDSLLHIATERLANPIALFDDRLALLGWSGSMPAASADTIWADVLLNGYSPAEFYTSDELRRIERELPRATWPLVLAPRRTPERSNLTRAIRIGERMVGTIGQVDVRSPFTPGQVGLADLVCDRLRLAFQQRLTGGPHEDGAAHLVRMAINTGSVDEGLLAYHLSKLHCDTAEGFLLLCCPVGPAGEQAVAKSVEARLGQALPHAVTLRYEDAIVSLAPAGAPLPAPYLQTLRRLGLRCARSEAFGWLGEIRTAYQQCRLALGGMTGGQDGPVTLADAFESLLPQLVRNEAEADALCSQPIHELATKGYQGDIARGRELVRELYAYLINGCNANLTARQLYLHRNTFAYHVEQLEGILGERFADMNRSRRLHLMVSCLLVGVNRHAVVDEET